MSAELDQDMLATLTEEERAAINESVSPDELAAMRGVAGDDDDDDDDAGGSAAPAAPAPAAASTVPAPAAAPAAQAASEGAADGGVAPEPAAPGPVVEPTTAYRATLPDDYDAQVKAIADERDGLKAKFKAGELELDEYEDARAALDERKGALDRQAVKAEVSAEMTQQSAQAQWNSAINRSFEAAAKPENGGVDYRTDEVKRGDLDGFVRALANNPANADKSMDWFLTEAHKRVLSLHDITVTRKPDPTPAPTPARRKPDPSSAPKNLADVPGTEAAGDTGDEFANLDQLEGVELEAAIARMSPDARSKYARG